MKFNDFFVIGTDTDVGKTYVSALLYKALKTNGYHYYKPVQSGCKAQGDKFIAPDVKFLCDFNSMTYDDEMVRYTLKEEVSPHLAAEMENTKIEISNIIEHYNYLKSKYKNLIVEGAGGLYVPIIRDEFYIFDLIKELNLPVVIVCGTKVGSINHSVLTIKMLERLDIKIQGLVFNNYKDNFYEKDNIREILEISKIKKHLIIKNKQENILEKDILKFFEA